MPYPAHDTRIYDIQVDPSRSNDAHAFMLGLVGANRRVLELGCTAGHVTRALVAQGCIVVGVELDPAAGHEARAVAEKVIIGDLDRPDLLKELATAQFDVVLAGDVLEHLRDPLQVLRACRPLLKPGGELIVSIPNVAHADVRLRLLGGDFPYHAFGLLDTTHLRFFTWNTLQSLLKAGGFVPVETRRVVVPMFATELADHQAPVDPQVVESILRDPEAETYQFVVRSVIDDGSVAVAHLVASAARLEASLRDRTIELALLGQRLTQTEKQLTDAERRADDASRRAEAAEQEVLAFHHIRLVRFTTPARDLYARLRSLKQP